MNPRPINPLFNLKDLLHGHIAHLAGLRLVGDQLRIRAYVDLCVIKENGLNHRSGKPKQNSVLHSDPLVNIAELLSRWRLIHCRLVCDCARIAAYMLYELTVYHHFLLAVGRYLICLEGQALVNPLDADPLVIMICFAVHFANQFGLVIKMNPNIFV